MVAQDIRSGAELIEAARALRPLIRAEADEIERERQLTPAVVRALREAGIIRMPIPRSWGGPEADIVTQIRVIEELSAADGSVGWCAMIGSDAGYFTAFLDEAVGRELYPDLDLITAAAARPVGRATAVDGGYRVAGRWAFASGCQHATWYVANCFVYDGDASRLEANGEPATLMCYLPMADCQILDTWRTTGLRGSGSHDVVVPDLFVPAERTFNVATSPITRDGPLYALRTMFIANGAGVPIGIARAAIDALVELAAGKVTRVGSTLRDESYVQAAVARAESLLRGTRAYLYEVMSDVWETLAAGRELSPAHRAHFRLSMAASCQQSVEVVDLMYQVGGGSSLYAANPLDRYLRDVHTAQQHVVNSPKVLETAGQMLLGLEPGVFGF